MDVIWLQLAIIVLLTLANGFFAASEIAMVSARRGRLQQQAEAGSRNAQVALDLAEEPNRFLATIQVGITLIGTFAGAYGGDVLAQPLAEELAPYVGPTFARTLALISIVVLITYLSLILGELVPKRLALQHAEGIATFVAPFMRFLSRLAAPVVWFLSFSTQIVLRLLGRSNPAEEQVTEEDILSLVREGTQGGTVAAAEQELIERVFEFSDASVRGVMTPRTEMVAVSLDMPLQEIVDVIVSSGYSRIPVYNSSPDTIVGVLYAKDLLRLIQPTDVSGTAPAPVQVLMRPPLFVFEHQRIATVLQQFKQTRMHLALVLDEYGQVDGLVTLEDVLEELAGDIADELDEADTMVVQRPDGSFLVDGLLSYADAQERIGLPSRDTLGNLPEFDTIAGLVLALLERIPSVGETATLHDWQFEVVDLDGLRIDKVLVRRLPPEPADERARNESALATGALLPPPDVPHKNRRDVE